MKISAVIPTRNRPESLKRTIESLLNQIRCPDEILVVDASDEKETLNPLKNELQHMPVRWLDSSASVCIQRNTGIAKASGDWIFLCDDDIELDRDYLQKLDSYLRCNEGCGAVAGRLLQRAGNYWVDQYPVKHFAQLLSRFIFQLSVWGSINEIKTFFFTKPLYIWIKKYYDLKGNTLTSAGWPLITQWEQEAFRTTFYSLGANLVRKDWLLQSPYDEVLDPHGIGDNYGVALNFPSCNSIHVLRSTSALHHKAPLNRLESKLIQYRRVLALHYFMKRSNKFSSLNFASFLWSLFGSTILFLLSRNRAMASVTFKAMIVVGIGRNPYWIGFREGKKTIQPEY